MLIEQFSMGIGDRFGRQGRAQLSAFIKAKSLGVNVVPVWNKSKREHSLIGSQPQDARLEADDAVKTLGWTDSYYVDADHIGMKTVDDFISPSDFFTIDVAESISMPTTDGEKKRFFSKCEPFIGKLKVPGIEAEYEITRKKIELITDKYLAAILEAGRIYRAISSQKGEGSFVTEVSLDENLEPQSPEELFFILLGLSMESVPVQTIAPKFSGRFNKGVDYVGDVDVFAREFEEDVLVVKHCSGLFALPRSLKLSVHSGSDKFSLYGFIGNIIKKYQAGLHLKTAGTTWLEELIGLAEAGGEGLALAKDIYSLAYKRLEELMVPYATVVDIDTNLLPDPKTVYSWSSQDYCNALRHNQQCPAFNLHFRQLLHLAYKIAAEMGARYTDALESNSVVIGRNVSENIFDRHLKPLFIS